MTLLAPDNIPFRLVLHSLQYIATGSSIFVPWQSLVLARLEKFVFVVHPLFQFHWFRVTIVHIILFRPGYESFSELLYQKDVPFLIFSAGLLNTITEILQQHQARVEDNVMIVSNRMRFDDSGVAVGFMKPVIHSYIKEKILDQFSETKNVIRVSTCAIVLFAYK